MRPRLAKLLKCVALLLWQPLSGPETASGGSGRRREHGEVVALAFVVCLALFLLKGFIAWRDLDDAAMPPQVWTGNAVISLARLWACSAEDFAVGCGCVLAGGAALRLLGPAGWRRALRLLAHVAAAAAIGLMVVNAQVFHVLRRFLTVGLVQLGGGFSPEKSVSEGATAATLLALALVPLLSLTLHLLLFGPLARFWDGLALCLGRPLPLLLLIGGLCGVASTTQRTLFVEVRSDFTRNPHLLLARSLFWDLDFGDLGPEPPETDDFLPGRPSLSGLSLERRPTNLVVIVCESLGASYCQLHGYPQATTPNLCRLAADGLVFDNFHANNNHTIASALPLLCGIWNDPRTLATLIEHPNFPLRHAGHWLRRQGYRTAFLGAGGRGAWEGYRNLAALADGFDLGRDRAHPFWQHREGRGCWEDGYRDDDLFADARRFLRGAGGDRFFLLLWNYDTHWPYQHHDGPEWDPAHFPAGGRGAEGRESFRCFLNSVRHVDALIGGFCDELERLGLADDTLVVVTADHGEGFGQHGNLGHGGTLHDEEVRVPLLLLNRHLAKAAGRRSGVLGSHVDLWPTIADVCGLPCEPYWQGRSLLGGAGPGERRVYFSRREQAGVREGRFKYIWNHEIRQEWLFDLEADPGEQVNLARERPDDCLRQRRRLRDWSLFQAELTAEWLRTGR
jgi:arylsulfatase A-like enzyme